MADEGPAFSGLMDALAPPEARVPDEAPPGPHAGKFAGLLNALGNPIWSDPSVPKPERVSHFLQSQGNAQAAWDDVKPQFKGLFPDEDPEPLRQSYEQQVRLEQHRERAKQGTEKLSSLLHRTAVPYASEMQSRMLDQNYAAASARFNKGAATEQDLADIAGWERLHEIDANRGPLGQIGVGLLKIPAIAGEMWAAGKALGPLGRAVGPGAEAAGPASRLASLEGAVGKAAATTPLVPSLYGEQARQNALTQGGGEFDLRNVVPAVALATLNNAAFAVTGAPEIPGAGVKRLLQRVAAGAGAGVAGQQVADATAGTLKLESGYGLFGDLANGDGGAALKRATVQAVSFAAFAGLHGRDPEKVMAPVQEAMAKLKARGMSAEGAGAAIAPVYKTLSDALGDNPNLSPAEARKLAEGFPDKVTQKLGRDLADQLPEPKNGTSPISAPAEPPKAPDQSGPGKATSDLDATTEALGMGPAVKEVPVKPEAPRQAEPFEQLPADELRQLSRQLTGKELVTASGLRNELRRRGLSDKAMSDLSAATAKPAVPEKAPGVPQEAPASQTAPEPAQPPPEQPQATPEDVHPAAEAFRQTFPGMELTPSGQLRATVGEGESARHVYLSDGESSPHAVRLDFSWADSERVGKGKNLQPGSIDLMRGVGQLLGRLKEAGSDVEYTAVGGREAVYKRMLERQGFEQVSGPVGEGNGLRVWRPKEATGAVEFRPAVDREQDLPPIEDVYRSAGLSEVEKHVVSERLTGRSHDEIAADAQLRKAGGGRLTRQRVAQIEREAMAKLGLDQSLAEVVHADDRAERAVEMMDRGQGVNPAELHADPDVVTPKAKRRLTARERVDAELERLADQMMKEAESGDIGPERERHYRDEAERIYRRAEAPERGEGKEPPVEPGVPGGADRPAPVRPEGRGGVPDAPAPAEAGPADPGGQPGAPAVEGAQRPGAAPEPAQRGPAGGNQLRKSAADITQEDAEGKLSRANGTPFYHEDMPPQERIDRAKAAILEEMRRPEKDRRTDGAIIAKVREKVDSTRREFDEALRQLRREKKLRLIAAGDLSEYTETELNRSLAGENETFVQAELSGESPGLTAGERLRRGRAVPKAFEAEARQLGVDPEDLHGHAREIKSADAAAVEVHNAFLREARGWLGNKGRRLADDPANVKGLDEAADAMADRYPGFFQGDEKPTDALYRLLKKGNQKPMSEADAYQQALTHLADLKAHAAATPEELADVNRRLEADGQPRATQADIGGLQEAAHRAAAAAPGGTAGEGPVGSAPAETDFDFGANEPGQRVAGTSPTRVPQPDPLADLARDFAAEESGAQPLHMIPAYQRAYDLVKRAVVYTGQAMARLSGKMFPAATALDREVGERMGNAAGAQAYVEHAKEYYRGKVFGDRAGDAEFRKLVGATDLELRFRYSMQARRNESAKASYAAHLARQQGDTAKAAEMAKRASDLLNKANATSTLVGGQNSPFKTEAEFQAARADPEVRAAMDRYEKYFVPRKEKNYRMSQGLDEADPIDSLTQRPGKDGRPGGHPLLALALTPDEVPGPGTVYADTAGRQGQGDRLSNLRLRRNPSSLEASLSAGAYETDLGEIMDRDLSRSYPIAVRAEAARLAVEKGVAKWGTDADRFAGFDKVPFTKPPRGTQENAPKQDTLFVRSEMAEEWTNAMHVGTPEAWKQWLAAANTVPNIAALSSSVEMAGHSVNQLRALFTKPSGAWDGGFSDFMGNLLKRFAPRWLGGNKAEFAEKLMRVAEVDALKPKGPETGTIFGALQGATKYLTGKDVPSGLKYADPTYYMGRVLDYLSDVTRATLGDWYDRQARQGKTEYSPAGKRDFINTSTGNYIRSSQNGVVRFLRDTGIGPFATAATTGITDTIRSLFLGTGLKATGLKAAVQMRAEVFAKMAAVVGATAVWNLAKWGRADGDDSTPFMALKVGIENGKTKSLDLTPLVGVKRGLRNLGVLGYIEAQRQGKTEGESEDKGLMQIVHSLAHPFMGPGPTFAKEAVLGTDAIGRRIAPTVSTATTAKGFNAAARMGKPLPGDPQWRENVKAAFKNANPAVAALTGADEPTKDVPVNERLAKLLGPYGFKYRDAAERKRKGLR